MESSSVGRKGAWAEGRFGMGVWPWRKMLKRAVKLPPNENLGKRDDGIVSICSNSFESNRELHPEGRPDSRAFKIRGAAKSGLDVDVFAVA